MAITDSTVTKNSHSLKASILHPRFSGAMIISAAWYFMISRETGFRGFKMATAPVEPGPDMIRNRFRTGLRPVEKGDFR